MPWLAALAGLLALTPPAVLTLAPAASATTPTQTVPAPQAAPAPQAPAPASQLASGATLLPGHFITSANGLYQLTMRPTGDLAETGPGGLLWSSGTTSPGTRLVNQPGGDLLLLTTAGTPVWTTSTDGQGPATLVVQPNGNVVDYHGTTPIWFTGIPAPASPPPTTPPPTTGPPGPSRAATAAIVYARKQIGKPYKYGGSGPASYDCSGLVEASYTAAGVAIPRTSQQQYQQGRPVAASARQPGDLVFYNNAKAPTHVAMYLGNNQIIESLKPGTDVRIDSVTYPGNPVGYRRYG